MAWVEILDAAALMIWLLNLGPQIVAGACSTPESHSCQQHRPKVLIYQVLPSANPVGLVRDLNAVLRSKINLARKAYFVLSWRRRQHLGQRDGHRNA